MLKRTRKRSARITLVLLGATALAACNSQDERRDLYANKRDCVQDWGDEAKCEVAPASATTGHSRTGTYYLGPGYPGSTWHSSGSSTGPAGSPRSGSRAVGSHSVSRGGFGSSASAHGSGGS